ncbi:MAG TPA: FmdB family zinc ribbon protein [Candidatus Acidoferrales bacterium]|nr:FmdB family zinc ribbon protein [Candidatus Acidoferrales bacterium]
MPIYEYICQDCETSYERLVRSKAEHIECPRCGSGRKQLKFSTFSSPNGSASGGSESSSSSGATDSCACTPRSCGCH